MVTSKRLYHLSSNELVVQRSLGLPKIHWKYLKRKAVQQHLPSVDALVRIIVREWIINQAEKTAEADK